MSGRLAEHVKDGIRATIYGNCIGDAIGLLTEFMPAYEARSLYENCRGSMHYGLKNDDRHRRNWQVGDWTDDSDQMILIMRSLCEHKKVDPVDYGGKLINWARHGFEELGDNGGCGLGATTHHVLKHPMYATDPHHAAQDIWERTGRQVAPNGAVMRTSVLGAYMFHDINAVIQNTLNICKVTHADTRCQASCVAVTTAIAQMLQQKRDHGDGVKHDVDAITQKSFEHALGCLDPEHRALRDDLEFHMKVKNLQDLQLDESGKIGYTYKCLGAGFWAFRQDDFRTALEELVLSGGDADTNGAVAGALLGCRLGLPGLPQQWLNGLLHKTWLDEVIAGFLQLIEQTPSTPSSPSSGLSTMTQQQSQAASEENQQTEAAANQSESAANPANEKREQESRVFSGCIPIPFHQPGRFTMYPKDKQELCKQICAVIYGNCIGDAIGLLSEFMTKEDALKHYGKKRGKLQLKHKVDARHQSRWQTGDWTDDSDQMILIMLSLLENNGQINVQDFGSRIRLWSQKGFPELGDTGGMGIGATTVQVIYDSNFLLDPIETAARIWRRSGGRAAPNGGVMRTAVLGAFCFHDTDAVVSNSRAMCSVTHADPRCQASCVAVSTAIALMLQQRCMTPQRDQYDVTRLIEESFNFAKTCLTGNSEQYIEELKYHMFAENISDLKLDEDKKIGYTFKCMGAGFWALKQADFRTALETIVFEGGDADTNGAVAGALLACKLGLHGLPDKWLKNLLHKNWLDDIIDRFIGLVMSHSPDSDIELRS